MQTTKESQPILVVGSINADLVVKVDRIPSPGETVLGAEFSVIPGGKGANQAVAIARLGYPVCMIGKVGSDAFGSQLRESLRGAGVDVRAVETVDTASGVALIEVGEQGENSIVVVAGANARLRPEDIESNLDLLRAAGLVLVQLEIPLETVARLITVCAREQIPVMMDPAPAQKLSSDVLRSVRWFTPNEAEAAFYTGINHGAPTVAATQRDALFSLGIRGVVLKQGARGVYLADLDGLDAEIPAFPVKPLDTTAAGDAFNGAFATGLMLGKEPIEGAIFAAAAAAISVTRLGAQPSMASLEETEELIKQFRPQ